MIIITTWMDWFMLYGTVTDEAGCPKSFSLIVLGILRIVTIPVGR
jgi:hypothetical protein